MVASARGEGLQVVQRAEEVVPVLGQGADGLGEPGQRRVQRLAVAVQVGGTDAHQVRQRTVGVGTGRPQGDREVVQRSVDLVQLHRGGGALQRHLGAVGHPLAAGVDRRELDVPVGHQGRRQDDRAGVGRDGVGVVDEHVHPHPVPHRDDVGDLADVDAQDPDVGAGVEPDGLAEPGGDPDLAGRAQHGPAQRTHQHDRGDQGDARWNRAVTASTPAAHRCCRRRCRTARRRPPRGSGCPRSCRTTARCPGCW